MYKITFLFCSYLSDWNVLFLFMLFCKAPEDDFLSFLSRQELLKRIQQCISLKEQYQTSFQKIRENLKENPSGKQFDFR